jgi:hypothetical protein
MPELKKITIVETTTLAEGDILITFSDGTTILYHARFLYDVRNHDHNINIVAPFEQ